MRLTKSNIHLLPFLVDIPVEEQKLWTNSKRKILDLMSDELLSQLQQEASSDLDAPTLEVFSTAGKFRRFKHTNKNKIDVNELKDRISLINIIDLYTAGAASNSRTKNIKCPFPEHKDDSPSFSFTNKAYFCFGCWAKGSIVDFVMAMENCDFQQSLNILKNF